MGIRFGLYAAFSLFCGLSLCTSSLELLQEVARESPNGIIRLNARTFETFLSGKRPDAYSMVVLFTIAQNCQICPDVESNFVAVANSYQEYFKKEGEKTPIFFAIINFEQPTYPIFQKYSVKTVPIIMVSHRPLENSKLPAMDTWYFSTSSIPDGDKIIEYVNKRTQCNVVLQKSMVEALGKALITLIFLPILVIGAIKGRWIIGHPATWFVLACLVFLICCGGVVHNILHRTPLSGVSRNQKGEVEYEYISTGNREQYAMEGYLASFLMLMGGGSLIAFFWVLSLVKDQNRRVYGYILLFANFITVYLLLSIYKVKSPWYGPTFAPPHDYVQGPLINDQGNSI